MRKHHGSTSGVIAVNVPPCFRKSEYCVMILQSRNNYPNVGISAFFKGPDHSPNVLVDDGDSFIYLSYFQQTVNVTPEWGYPQLDRSKHPRENLPKILSLRQL